MPDSNADYSSKHMHARDIKEFPSPSTIRNTRIIGRRSNFLSVLTTFMCASKQRLLHAEEDPHKGEPRVLAKASRSDGSCRSTSFGRDLKIAGCVKQGEALRADGMEPTGEGAEVHNVVTADVAPAICWNMAGNMDPLAPLTRPISAAAQRRDQSRGGR